MSNNFFTGIGFWILIVLLGGCTKNTDVKKADDNGKDRTAMLTHYADSIIIPAYGGFKASFDLMQERAESFVANPSASGLSSFRSAWAEAYIQWQTVELFDFGPAEFYTLRNFCNIYPADTTGIIKNVSNANASLEVPASYAQQGFPALDYLINGVRSNDADIVAYYKADSKRGAYINRITGRMKALLEQVMADWNGQSRLDYIQKTGLDINSSTSRMVNGIVLHYERFIRSGKIGIPSGVMLNGVVSPEKVEAYYKKDLSRALAQSAHEAFVAFVNGKAFHSNIEGPSLKTYLDALDAKDNVSGKLLTQIMNDQLNTVRTEMDLLMPDFYQQILTDNNRMKQMYSAMQAAVRMLKVDMTSAMSITITYTDNDGD
jgi:predicted lipoprotein